MDSRNLKIKFKHHQSAHCESGVVSNLFRHYGIEISEAMAFGIGAGLFFAYLPFVRINALPLITFRSVPGRILKRVTKCIGASAVTRTFSNPQKAMAALDNLLDQGIPVGVQAGVYWLPYFPPALRFHFNAHNLVVYGRQKGHYLISDPVLGKPVTCPAEDLERARFAKGALAPRGRMYYFSTMPRKVDMSKGIKWGIRTVCRTMTKAPLPLVGVKGIRLLASRLEQWPDRLGRKKALIHLGHVIRMQEEIGTGGAGFRFIFAAFLQEAGHLLKNRTLFELSARMTETGDRWREFAASGAQLCKNRAGDITFSLLAEQLRNCAGEEEELLRCLGKAIR